MAYTQQDADNLRAAIASGVLQVRDGNDFVEYQSLQQMRLALKDIEASLAHQADSSRGVPMGTRLVKVKKGYY